MSEVIISLKKDLKRVKTILETKKMVEVGIQAVPEVVSATTETDPQVKEKEKKTGLGSLEQAMNRKREKGKGKEKEGAKDNKKVADTPPAKKQQKLEDVEMGEAGRYILYEDLSAYEEEKEEDVAPGTPPVVEKQTVRYQAVSAKLTKLQVTKNKKKPISKVIEEEEYVDSKAF